MTGTITELRTCLLGVSRDNFNFIGCQGARRLFFFFTITPDICSVM